MRAVVVSSETVENVVLLPDDYAEHQTLESLLIVEDNAPFGPGWRYVDSKFIPPPILIASPESIPPDGVTSSLITYTDEFLGDYTEVTFNINGGLSEVVPVISGVASLEVVCSEYGILEISVNDDYESTIVVPVEDTPVEEQSNV